MSLFLAGFDMKPRGTPTFFPFFPLAPGFKGPRFWWFDLLVWGFAPWVSWNPEPASPGI